MIHPDYKEYAEMLEPKLKHAHGNLLDMAEAGEFDIVVQGCNCFNTMGGGIAREIRERYPQAAGADNMTDRGNYMKLGTWTYAPANHAISHPNNFLIINAYTQYSMSNDEDVFEYVAFTLILQKLAHLYPTKRFGFPFIGQGLARGNPARINEMLENFAATITATGGTVTIVKFNQ
jgi:O-acetyl-ADP-ribose deacetylase (regulator of RNase III)